MYNNQTKKFTGIFVIVFLFVCTSVFAQFYGDEILILNGAGRGLSMATYVLSSVVATIIAPISTMPLIPIAVHLWGWFTAAILSIIGWLVGAQIAFTLSRYFGKPLIQKIFSLEKLQTFENRFSDKNLFVSIIFLRMLIPVDILSYALGLFSKIKTTPFFFATLIGVTPFAFIFAYVGSFSIKFQFLFFVGVIVFLGLIYIAHKICTRTQDKNIALPS